MPWIGAAVVLVLIIAGAVVYFATRGGDSPSPNPTADSPSQTSPSSTGPTSSAPAAAGPFGTIPGATNDAAGTGTLSLADALAKKVMTQAEYNTLTTCGSKSGATQQLTASDWTGRGWVYACAGAPQAQQVVSNLGGYFHSQGYQDLSIGSRGVYVTMLTSGPTTTVEAEFASNDSVVFVAATSADPNTATAQVKALLAAVAPQYPSTFPAS
jgi:hypothetical protein